MGGTPFYRTSNKLKHHFLNIKQIRHVHVLAIELEHPYFGFEQTDIEPITRFTRLIIKQTRTSIIQTSNRLEYVYL